MFCPGASQWLAIAELQKHYLLKFYCSPPCLPYFKAKEIKL